MDFEIFEDSDVKPYAIDERYLEQEINIFWSGIEAWIESTVWEAEYEY